MIFVAVMHYDAPDNLSVKEKSAYESELTYALLFALYERIYGKSAPNIIKDENGKPYFLKNSKEKNPSFNLSHTDGASLVAIDTSAGPIGVDIQIDVSPKKGSRIAERFSFINDIKPGDEFCDVEFLSAKIQNKKLVFSEIKCPINEKPDSFCSKWALTEALLKSDGGGFRSSSKIQKIKKYYSLSFSLKQKYLYFASVVSLTPDKKHIPPLL